MSLFFWSVAESIFFPIPPDPLIMALALQNSSAWLMWGILATSGSLLGALIGYLLGISGGRLLLERFFSPAKIRRVERLFHKYDAWAIAIAGLSPLPYKLFTVGAGAFQLRMGKFLLVSLLSRGFRFFSVSYLVARYGQGMVFWLKEYYDLLTVAVVIMAVLSALLYKALKGRVIAK